MSDEGSPDSRVISAPDQERSSEPVPRWSRAKLIAFRFAFILTALSAFTMIGFVEDLAPSDALRRLAGTAFGRWDWFLFGALEPIGAFIVHPLMGSKSTIHEILNQNWNSPIRNLSDLIGLFVVASLATIVWTTVDRRRVNYSTLNRPMRVYLRYALGATMLTYAISKVIPTQFGFLTPGQLLQPIGQLPHFLLLWDFMAASPGYTVFSGLIELVGATLLFFRRTTLLGGLVTAGALTNVLAMDLGYKIGVVHFAIIFLLLDSIILAPYLPGLCAILLGQGKSTLPAEPSPRRPRWYHAPVTKGVVLCALALPLVHRGVVWRQSYFGAGLSVYGLFDVTAFTQNGQTVRPLATDRATWKRIASTGRYGKAAPAGVLVQFASGDLHRFRLADDTVHHTWTISQWDQSSTPVATLHYAVLQDRDVSLDGKLGNDSVHMLLHPVDMKKFFPLLTK